MQDKKLNRLIQDKLGQDKILAEIFRLIIKKHKGDTSRQRAIRVAVEVYERRHPQAMEELDLGIKRRKELALNDFAATDQDQRHFSAVPAPLVQRINMIVGSTPFLSDEAIKEFKEDEWFVKEFPRYSVAKRF